MNSHSSIVNNRPLSLLALWVLIGLADEPCHIYGLQGRIYGRSLASVVARRDTLRKTADMLLAAGLIHEHGTAPAAASRHERKLYAITPQGLGALRSHRSSLALAVQGIDQAFARR